MPQLVLRQAIVPESDSSGRTQGTRVMTTVAYVYPQKARPDLMAKTTDFEVMIGIGEVKAGAPGSKGWTELI